MIFQPRTYGVLIVSSSEKFISATKELLPVTDYWPVESAESAGAARRLLLMKDFDIVIINSPLTDEFGPQLAEDITAEYSSAVLLLTKGEVYEDVYYKVLISGVASLPKPINAHTMETALRILSAERERLRKSEEKRVSVEEKIEEIRLVNRAKWALIEKSGLTEEEAHRHIEKLSMDKRISKSAAAKLIINNSEILN